MDTERDFRKPVCSWPIWGWTLLAACSREHDDTQRP